MKNCLLVSLLVLLLPSFSGAQIPAGIVGSYQLNATAIDLSGNGYNGTLTSTTGTTNRFGTANTATAFTAGVFTGSLPLTLVTALQNDFSYGFWIKTNMVANSSSQWYGGNALVDAEVCGSTSDYGTALIDGGKIAFGIGNPDITIKSVAATYNDNAWHFVTVVRNKAAGSITLYADGAQVASTTGTSTAALTAPSFIGLGNNPCATGGVYTGALDDIICYNRVLSGAEVTNLYNALNASALPLHWLSFTGLVKGQTIELKWEVEKSINNDHFEIEHSTDGIHFSLQGTRRDNESITTTGGRLLYTFPDTRPASGANFYRIKQVDADGNYSYSKTIQVSLRGMQSGLYIQSNPVRNELVLMNSDQKMIKQLQVIDISGKIIKEQTVNSNNSSVLLNTHELKTGYYLLRVDTGDGITNLRLIKM